MEVNTAFAPPYAPGDVNAPAEASGQDTDFRTKIFDRIQEQTRPAPLPKPWAFLGPTKSARQVCGDPVNLLESLQAEFGVEQLLAERIIELSPDHQPRLSPIFGDVSSSFVIRRAATRSRIDAISARGVLSSSRPDWLRIAAERTDEFAGHQQPVLLACSDPEILVLNRLSCHFTAAAGLEQLSGNHVRELVAGRAKQRWERRYTLSLPGWRIAELMHEPAPATVAALRRILQLQPLFNLDLSDIFDVWMPTGKEFRAIRNALRSRDREGARRAFHRSLAKSRFTPADALRLVRDRSKIDYGTARRNLILDIGRSAVVPRCAEVGIDLAKLRKAFTEVIVDKFVDPDGEINDPWEKLRSLMGADLATGWFETLDEVAAARKIIAGEYPDRRDADERLEKRLRFGDAFVKLYALPRVR